MNTNDKLKLLKSNLSQMKNLIIAFSGGVDSTFLLKIAHDVLGENVIAVTAKSSTYPEREYLESIAFANSIQVKHLTIESEELDIQGFSENPINRCYLCKNELFSKIIEIAKIENIESIADGANFDDASDYRPGMIATRELGILSPLKEVGLTKLEIRALSKELQLKTWDKQSFACLSSRFPYGNKITKEALRRVDLAEQYLLDLGFKQVRVRDYGDLSRIEVDPLERKRFFEENLMDDIYDAFKKIGYQYTTLDLKGYRIGSMNEILEVIV